LTGKDGAGEEESGGAVSAAAVAAVAEFRRVVWANYEQAGRAFPWRQKVEPWPILLSEVMLQQTQTERVVPYWTRWVALWPRPADLAAAPLDQVFREWSGLGYNRRARFLAQAAGRIQVDHTGRVPEDPAQLEALPGIGPYTARAVACFAYGRPLAFVETNIRAAAIHFFFQDRAKVTDAELMPLLDAALDRERPREWHWALMDYGAALKKITANPGRRSAGYARQARFEGSPRQARGAVLRCLAAEGPRPAASLAAACSLSEDRIAGALRSLAAEGMVCEQSGEWRVSPKKEFTGNKPDLDCRHMGSG